MNSLTFTLCALFFIAITAYVFLSYPRQWRKNRTFISVVIVWHSLGLICVVIVFTVFKKIPYEGFKYEICRLATFHYITMFLLAIFFTVRRIVNAISACVRKAKGTETNNDHVVSSIIFIVVAYLICLAGFFNVDILHTKKYEVNIAKPASIDKLDICLLSDIHAGSGTWEYTYDDLANNIEYLHPDVLLIAGDVFDETTAVSDIDLLIRALKEISRPKYGIYFIYGNHDGELTPYMKHGFEEAGITILEDDMVTIASDVQLVGLNDPKMRKADPEEIIRSMNPDTKKPLLVLYHRPSHYKEISETGADLILSGHTHGFNIPQFLGTPLFGDMFYGERKYNNTTAIVSSGVSAWGFHYKWPAKSEVVGIHVTFENK